MAGATHPFFGNQYTDGGYITGSFKFPEGLTREVGERIAKLATPDTIPIDTSIAPPVRIASPLKTITKPEIKGKWILPTIIVTAVIAASSYLAYRYHKKKGVVKVPNIGVCEHCGEPLTGAKLIADNENQYIICKKCGEKNYAHYHGESDGTSTSPK